MSDDRLKEIREFLAQFEQSTYSSRPPTAVDHARFLLAECEHLTRERDAAMECFGQMEGQLKSVIDERDRASAERDRMRDLIERMRGQWIHSVHQDDCLKAIGETNADDEV